MSIPSRIIAIGMARQIEIRAKNTFRHHHSTLRIS
jgi:hypothetical protein